MGKPGSAPLASLAGLLGSREQPLAPASLQVSTEQPLSGQRLFYERQDSDSGFSFSFFNIFLQYQKNLMIIFF